MRAKWTVTGRNGVDILEMIAFVNGSKEVLDDGTIMPSRTGAVDILSNGNTRLRPE